MKIQNHFGYSRRKLPKNGNSDLIISIIIVLSIMLLLFIGITSTNYSSSEISLKKTEKKVTKKKKKKSNVVVKNTKDVKTYSQQFRDESYTKISIDEFRNRLNVQTNFRDSVICGDFVISRCRVGVCRQLHVPEKNIFHPGATGYVFVVFEKVVTNNSNSPAIIDIPTLIAHRGETVLHFNPVENWCDALIGTGNKLNPEFSNRKFIVYQIPEKYAESFQFLYYENLLSWKVITPNTKCFYDVITLKNVK